MAGVPRLAWDTISAAATAGDYGAVWDRFDPASQQRMAPRLREFDGATDRDRFARACAERPDVMGQFLPGTVLGVEQSGEWARVRLGRPDPLDRSPVPDPTSAVTLARYGGRWCRSSGTTAPPR